jgi:hypothetical protein
MLWSQMAAIFAFWVLVFSSKRFCQNLALFWVKIAKFLAKTFLIRHLGILIQTHFEQIWLVLRIDLLTFLLKQRLLAVLKLNC